MVDWVSGGLSYDIYYLKTTFSINLNATYSTIFINFAPYFEIKPNGYI